MGRVEVALDEGHAGIARVVALKRQLPEAQHDALVDMFLREARIAALLDHPNVIRAYDYGTKEGELFLAMEYVEGETLALVLERAKDNRLPPMLAAHVVAEICEGLHAAHELRDAFGQPLGIVHRDVSPHNVMIGYDGRVRLVDFGVAKVDLGARLTRTGEVKGKAAYMSPEQALGDALDRRSDLYAVGAVLFESVSGRRMWPGDTDMEVIRRLALEEPPRLEDAPALLVDLQTRLVRRNRDERPATARAVAEELRSWLGEAKGEALREEMVSLFREDMEKKEERLREALFAATGKRAQSPTNEAGGSTPKAPPAPITEKMLGTAQAPSTPESALAFAPTLAGTPPSNTPAIAPPDVQGLTAPGMARSYPPAPVAATDPRGSHLPVLLRWGAVAAITIAALTLGIIALRTSSMTRDVAPAASVPAPSVTPPSAPPAITPPPSAPSTIAPAASSAPPKPARTRPSGRPTGPAQRGTSSAPTATPTSPSPIDPNPI